MSRLRVVTAGDAGEAVTFEDAARSSLEAALASGAQAVVILYEVGNVFNWHATPPSEALARGMVDTIHDLMQPGAAE